MEDDDLDLSPATRAQLLENLDEMEEILRSIRPLADRRGLADDWTTLDQGMVLVRVWLQHGAFDLDFPDALELLCLQYDAFVETLFSEPVRH